MAESFVRPERERWMDHAQDCLDASREAETREEHDALRDQAVSAAGHAYRCGYPRRAESRTILSHLVFGD